MDYIIIAALLAMLTVSFVGSKASRAERANRLASGAAAGNPPASTAMRVWNLIATLFLVTLFTNLVLILAIPDEPTKRLMIGFIVASIGSTIGNLVATQAEIKGRSWIAFYWLSIIASPIVTGIIVATLKSEQQNSSNDASPKGDPIDQLKRLKDLLDSGVISQEEFDDKKRVLLGKV